QRATLRVVVRSPRPRGSYRYGPGLANSPTSVPGPSRRTLSPASCSLLYTTATRRRVTGGAVEYEPVAGPLLPSPVSGPVPAGTDVAGPDVAGPGVAVPDSMICSTRSVEPTTPMVSSTGA